MTDIPHHWLVRAGTPEEFERAQLERTAAAFNLPFEKVALKFGAWPFGEMLKDGGIEAWPAPGRTLNIGP